MASDVRLIRSPISVAGMVLTTISAVVFLVVFLAELFGLHTNPYLGVLFFLILPVLFVARPPADSARGLDRAAAAGRRETAVVCELAAPRPQ